MTLSLFVISLYHAIAVSTRLLNDRWNKIQKSTSQFVYLMTWLCMCKVNLTILFSYNISFIKIKISIMFHLTFQAKLLLQRAQPHRLPSRQRRTTRGRLYPLSPVRGVTSGSGNRRSDLHPPLSGSPHTHRGCDGHRWKGRTPQLNVLPGHFEPLPDFNNSCFRW